MNKTAFKIFFGFSAVAVTAAVILLLLNAFGFAIIASDERMHIFGKAPQSIVANVDSSLTKTADGYHLSDSGIIPDDCWCILINGDGDIIWSENQPDDIPTHYTINDVARLTKWFLNDYPVYVRTNKYGLLIFGIPKNSVGKYDMAYSMEWFRSLPQRLAAILIVNIALALGLVVLFGINLYGGIRRLVVGMNDLKSEKLVKLPEKGLFKEVSRSINATSAAIERKNLMLSQRENARSNWISGISHDIRTPLSIIMGYSEELSSDTELSKENRKKINAVNQQSVKIKKLIEDLNLISSLEYDMQPSRKKPVRICPLLRRVTADAMNSPNAGKFKFEMNFSDEKAEIMGDEPLLERAVFNLINNSMTHNESGCKISIFEVAEKEKVKITIRDNGKGVDEETIANITDIPKSEHGLGLPMAYRIITAHGGKFTTKNDNGFCAEIEIDLCK